ncbi:MAG: TIGR00282 family metallophosphoesterase [Patescibacteria group bacterium]
MKILFIGDIVGKPGRQVVAKLLPSLKKEKKIDFVVANGENLSSGKGMTKEKYDEMLRIGVDYFTSGNHIWDNRDIIPYLKDKSIKVLRPANYPSNCPGEGFATFEVNGHKVTLINLLGQVFIPVLSESPFKVAKEIADENKDSIVLIDIHAEATSEKIALAHYLDGQVSAVMGTHTHVQTADDTILEEGTAFLSDLGMCGPKDSVLGVEKGIIIKQFLTALPQSHKVAVGTTIFNACLVEIDTRTKKAVSIERIYETVK